MGVLVLYVDPLLNILQSSTFIHKLVQLTLDKHKKKGGYQQPKAWWLYN